MDPLDTKLDQCTYALGEYQKDVQAKLKELQQQDFVRRFWAKDPTLWHQDPEHHKIIRNAMGWLHIIEQQGQHVSRLKALSESVRGAGFQHILLLGMGGSSLCPEVFRITFGSIPGYPQLHVLDSTVPAQIKRFEKDVELGKTLCIVSSKSGSTIEPLVFYKYFFDRMKQIKGERAGDHFIAITDPGSLLQSMATESKFREILPGVPDIGGRYSALSNFGIAPAALMGINVEDLLTRAEQMRHRCDSGVPAEDNPGFVLGVTLGELAKRGRDKITFVTSSRISGLGSWMEQLIAESTGKEGKGVIPIDGEALGTPDVYGKDRLFVYIRYTKEARGELDVKLDTIEKAGHPVVRVDLLDLINLGEEFFLWEMATAVACSILGVNAFDQPNVQESKDFTKTLLDEFKKTNRLPEEEPFVTSDGIRLFADAVNRQAFGQVDSLDKALAAHMKRISPGDYVAVNAYVAQGPANDEVLQALRMKIRDRKRIATTLGYGPRFLHSTGQLHKGGPNSGVFLQITSDDADDVKIPGEPFTFGVLKAAQALGDFQSLSRRNRRLLRVHLGKDVEAGLRRLRQAVDAAV